MGHTYCDDDDCHISVSTYTFLWVMGFFIIVIVFLAIYSAWLFSKSCMFWIFMFFLFATGGLFIWFLVDYYA